MQNICKRAIKIRVRCKRRRNKIIRAARIFIGNEMTQRANPIVDMDPRDGEFSITHGTACK